MSRSAHAHLLGAGLLAVLMLPVAGTATAGCGGGCNYAISFKLHATVVDAVTGQPILAPTFIDESTGMPIPSSGNGSVVCDTPEAGACSSWTVWTSESTSQGGILVGAPGYSAQSQTVPVDVHRCVDSGDEVTRTFRLGK